MIYADHTATTPIRACALTAMTAAYGLWGNPSSLHRMGRDAREALEDARSRIARLLGASPAELVFTSGGSEADNMAIRAAAAAGARAGKKHVVSTAVEHHAVLNTLRALESEGFEVELLPVSPTGSVTAEQVAAAIRPDTALVTVMYANNEIGTVQPVRAIGAVCRARGVIFHTDAVQAVGHIPVDVARDGVDMLSLSAHKLGGPRGVGALYVRQGMPVVPLIHGGGQERGRRAGTENVPAAVGMAAALEEAVACMDESARRITVLRDRLAGVLLSAIPRAYLNGESLGGIPLPDAPFDGTVLRDLPHRLPGVLSLSMEGIDGEALVYRLDMAGIAVSAGSACTAGSPEPSHVILALGRQPDIALGTVRISLGEGNTDEDIARMAEIIPRLVADLRNSDSI